MVSVVLNETFPQSLKATQSRGPPAVWVDVSEPVYKWSKKWCGIHKYKFIDEKLAFSFTWINIRERKTGSQEVKCVFLSLTVHRWLSRWCISCSGNDVCEVLGRVGGESIVWNLWVYVEKRLSLVIHPLNVERAVCTEYILGSRFNFFSCHNIAMMRNSCNSYF